MNENRTKTDSKMIAQKLIAFIGESTTAFQTVETIEKQLRLNGYEEYKENKRWDIRPGSRGFVVRNGSSVIAFEVPDVFAPAGLTGCNMICVHSDSPSFKIKESPETVSGEYRKLNVEKYGGMIESSWLDRPLSAAGRIVCDQNGSLQEILIDLKKDLFIIPGLAIHMTRGDKKGELNAQTDLQPLAGSMHSDNEYYQMLAEYAGVTKEKILGADMFLYNRQPGCIMGMHEELLGAPRLDDLACVFAGFESFIAAGKSKNTDAAGEKIRILGVFDNEEVGSLTRQGADSDFLESTLANLAEGIGLSAGDYRRLMAGSFMISADNAHAVHPNHPEKADVTNQPYLNGGIVIKYHGGQKYTTDAYTGAVVKKICKSHNIPYQTYHNRSDIAGGSTLGNIALGKVSVPAADIGIPQLAMHSAFETAGVYDLIFMAEFMQEFYKDSLCK